MQLKNIIYSSKEFLSNKWKESFSSFLEEEHWNNFSNRMALYLTDGIPESHLLPQFHEEVTPPLLPIIQSFNQLLTIKDDSVINSENTSKLFANFIETTSFEYLLIILGQRFTSASLKDKDAIPPLKKTLLKSCLAPFNSQISLATRAWEKHIGRSEDNFWGEIKGNSQAKEEKVITLINTIIEDRTWWNIFFHYKHGLVYEIRIPSGHGIRWNKKGTQLIGFLEPFLEGEE